MGKLILSAVLFMLCASFALADIGEQPENFEKPLTLSRFVSAFATGGLQPVITETGKIAWSIDAAGTNTGTAIVQVQKPVGATVRSAYLMAASTGYTGYHITNSDVTLAGMPVVWDTEVANDISSYNYFSDVTYIVKPVVDGAAAGLVDLTVTEANTYSIEGETLVVIFDDASQPDSTIILAFGAQQKAGDTFHIGLAEPINQSTPGFQLDMSLGISYSYQAGSYQYSTIDINGARLTTWAGGEDDGSGQNGALITTGGIGDSSSNPPNPNANQYGDPRYDDELYDLTTYVADGDTSIDATTQNPSNDDNIYFAGFFLGATTAVVGEGIVLSPQTATNLLGEDHTVTATVQDTNGDPVVGVVVTFEIISGPNAPMEYNATTDASGKATFTYTSSVEGLDELEASFVNSQSQVIESNHVTKLWTTDNEIPEFGLVAGLVTMLGALGVVAFKRH